MISSIVNELAVLFVALTDSTNAGQSEHQNNSNGGYSTFPKKTRTRDSRSDF